MKKPTENERITILLEEWLKLAERREGFPCLFCDGNVNAIQVNADERLLGHSAPVCEAFTQLMTQATPLPRGVKA